MAVQENYLVQVILVMAAATVLPRLLPFVFFARLKQSVVVAYLGRYLPVMVMPILVIYALKETDIAPVKNAIPELIAVITVAGVHLWQRNALLSIALGTALFVWLKHFT